MATGSGDPAVAAREADYIGTTAAGDGSAAGLLSVPMRGASLRFRSPRTQKGRPLGPPLLRL